jgi:hypothetical protein
MIECNKDCLSCSNSLSIPNEESISGADALFCDIKQEIVSEDGYCEEYN